jgi:ABC-type thiamine transport system ATPase subunit
MNHTARILPRHLVIGTVGWISACGAGGSTLLSIITGMMASQLGIASLQPLCVFYPTPPSFLNSLLFFPP